MASLLDQLPRPFFALAPMDDVTETVFRTIVADCASPDLFFTEFVNVDGLMSIGRPRLLKKLQFGANETRLIAQLWGLQPDNFKAIAEQIADGSLTRELGLPDGCNFVGIDLNMGCPAKSEVQNGACAALIKRENWPLAKEIIQATKDGVAGRMPVSVKTRLGFNDVDMDWINFLLQQDVAMLTVHGRTRKQMSKVPANWELIGQARELRDKSGTKTLVLGNGDVRDRRHGEELAKQYKLDGIMIGRGIFQDPFAFAADSPWPNYTKQQRIALYKKHVELFAKTWTEQDRRIVTLNKFCKVYISDFDDAKELREQFMTAQTVEQLLTMIDRSQ